MQVRWAEHTDCLFGRKIKGTLYLIQAAPGKYYYAIKPFSVWVIYNSAEQLIEPSGELGKEIVKTIKEFISSAQLETKSQKVKLLKNP